MKNQERKNSCMQNQALNNVDIVKDTIVKLHEKNKDDVPQYLDELKEEKNLKEQDATFDNDFLKYMI